MLQIEILPMVRHSSLTRQTDYYSLFVCWVQILNISCRFRILRPCMEHSRVLPFYCCNLIIKATTIRLQFLIAVTCKVGTIFCVARVLISCPQTPSLLWSFEVTQAMPR